MRSSETDSTVIVVANRPRIFRELLARALAGAATKFEVLEVTTEAELPKLLRGIKADWLIVTAAEDRGLPPQAQSLLASKPELSVVAVSPDGAQVAVLLAKGEERVQQVYRNISLAEFVAVLSSSPEAVDH